ncbi:hypothetical protein IMZ48_28755 [Candidatus Bathyarchaeota archaeon]|nr:hypothetical protein [Candidatus Bathyarchaeota archaeon]
MKESPWTAKPSTKASETQNTPSTPADSEPTGISTIESSGTGETNTDTDSGLSTGVKVAIPICVLIATVFVLGVVFRRRLHWWLSAVARKAGGTKTPRVELESSYNFSNISIETKDDSYMSEIGSTDYMYPVGAEPPGYSANDSPELQEFDGAGGPDDTSRWREGAEIEVSPISVTIASTF